MLELVDKVDSKSTAERRGGSSPPAATIKLISSEPPQKSYQSIYRTKSHAREQKYKATVC